MSTEQQFYVFSALSRDMVKWLENSDVVTNTLMTLTCSLIWGICLISVDDVASSSLKWVLQCLSITGKHLEIHIQVALYEDELLNYLSSQYRFCQIMYLLKYIFWKQTWAVSEDHLSNAEICVRSLANLVLPETWKFIVKHLHVALVCLLSQFLSITYLLLKVHTSEKSF